MIPFKEFSLMCDRLRLEQNRSKMWLINKIFYYLFWSMVFAFAVGFIKASKEKRDFNRKYKTVVKENILGFRSYEYHERD